ncbi:hypothetical protein PF010_g30845, partial [Phytophthora fragariae]
APLRSVHCTTCDAGCQSAARLPQVALKGKAFPTTVAQLVALRPRVWVS